MRMPKVFALMEISPTLRLTWATEDIDAHSFNQSLSLVAELPRLVAEPAHSVTCPTRSRLCYDSGRAAKL